MQAFGKSGRLQFVAILFAPSLILVLIALVFQNPPFISDWAIFVIFYGVWIVGAIRRLNDIDANPLLLLLMFVPLGGFGLMLYLLFAPGKNPDWVIDSERDAYQIANQNIDKTLEPSYRVSEESKLRAQRRIDYNKKILEENEITGEKGIHVKERYCSNCGRGSKPEETFCPDCGKKLEA